MSYVTKDDAIAYVPNLVLGAKNIDRMKSEVEFVVGKILALARKSSGMDRLLWHKDAHNNIESTECLWDAQFPRGPNGECCYWEMRRLGTVKKDGNNNVHVRCVKYSRRGVGSLYQMAYCTSSDWRESNVSAMGLEGWLFAHKHLPVFVHGMLEHSYFPELKEQLQPYLDAATADHLC